MNNSKGSRNVMKKNMIIWLILIVILVGGLTIIALKIKNANKEYKTLEKKMTDVAKAYYGEKPGLLKNNETISIQDLSDYDNTLTNKVNEEECNGYVKTTSNMGIFEYKAYIKCNEYTTKGYVNQSST